MSNVESYATRYPNRRPRARGRRRAPQRASRRGTAERRRARAAARVRECGRLRARARRLGDRPAASPCHVESAACLARIAVRADRPRRRRLDRRRPPARPALPRRRLPALETSRVRVSLSITEYPREDIRGHLARIVRAADEGGLDTVWVTDHLFQAAPGTSRDDPMLEAYTTLGYLAGCSQRVRLGAMVSPATYRAPALLLKAVESLNELSGGRAWLGVGAGDHEEEGQRVGLDPPPMPERFERLAQLLERAEIHPILIGGSGERRTLRLVARYADACNVFDIPDGGTTVRHKLEVLQRHCDEVGRPFGDILKTISTRLSPGQSPDDFARELERIGSLGIE